MAGRRITRRGFVKGTAGTAAGLSLAAAAGPATGALGANEKIVMGFIGTGGQGMAHLQRMSKMPDVAIAAVCDVDPARYEAAAQTAGSSPKMCKDFRQVLDMKDIDAVLIATPGHWHVITAVAACQAGKDVYVEKPLGHNIREGRVFVDAAQKYNRVTQVGMQQRSAPHWINAVKRIHDGEFGKITMVHVWNAWSLEGMFGDIGNPPDSDPPPGVDYDLWLGPAPARPFNRLHFHGTHYFFWNYGGGMMNEWAIHLFDVVAWAMKSGVRSVAAIGGKLAHDDARETPDTAGAVFECPGYTMVYTLRHANNWPPHGQMDHGIEFFGSKATLQINRSGFQMYHEADRDTRKPFYSEQGDTTLEDHERNFLECVRTRKPTNAYAEIGHRGSIIGHLANISYRVGRRVRWDAEAETIPDDPEAAILLTRQYRAPWHV